MWKLSAGQQSAGWPLHLSYCLLFQQDMDIRQGFLFREIIYSIYKKRWIHKLTYSVKKGWQIFKHLHICDCTDDSFIKCLLGVIELNPLWTFTLDESFPASFIEINTNLILSSCPWLAFNMISFILPLYSRSVLNETGSTRSPHLT